MRCLSDMNPGVSCVVAEVRGDEETRGWLAAVGIAIGDELMILRRAPFRGPLHVRTAAGGEFALAEELARAIGVDGAEERA